MKRLFLIMIMVLSCLVMAGQETGSTDADSGLGGVVTMNRTEDDSEPVTLSDFILIMFFLSSLVGYFVFCKSNADKAEARGLSGSLWLVLSIFFSPILAWIPLLFIKESK